MSVTYPAVFTAVDDLETTVERPTSEETIRKIIQNINMLSKLNVIGSVRAIALNQAGVPAPTTSQWQVCDGSAITDTNTPLSGNTPNIRSRFIRGANGSTTSGNELGGAASVSHTHTHGGVTGAYTTPSVFNVDADGSALPVMRIGDSQAHTHNMTTESVTATLDPLHEQVEFYLKIN